MTDAKRAQALDLSLANKVADMALADFGHKASPARCT